ncbi:hypothetical protein GcC1_206004 [Golovinomyces cichoracearum]|uniref:YAG7-like dimerisation domain-containing protein n=1 Tax=Golovinomyces cichoracearum TaxID=62708 RepID=A0A420HCF7_9PEZI|nr:hypothetical protein GcC1_206004 [Golovinomyces cichoracearum]
MALPEVINPSHKTESKSAKKKKAAKTTVTETSTQVPTFPEKSQPNGLAPKNNSEESHENSYIRELQKNIRNVNKKITNASKVDNVISENPDMTLDELVAARKINADQKAQILKKPALQASLVQLEDQVAQYTLLDAEFRTRSQNEKNALEKTLKEVASRELEDVLAAAKIEAKELARKHLEESLLLLSQFLKLAAIRRAEEEAAELEESKALEGLLAQVYSGDANAVVAMLNLIDGTEETLTSVNGEALKITYAQLKATSKAQVPYVENEGLITESQVLPSNDQSAQDDSTNAYAELEQSNTANSFTVTNGLTESHQTQETKTDPEIFSQDTKVLAENTSGDGNDLSQSQEWVKVPNNVKSESETETISNVPAPIKGQSWADDQPDIIPKNSTPPAPTPSDGFQEIQRNRGGRSSRGRYSDGHRGRGSHRGDGSRGRGRGGNHRGSRRSDD